MLTVARKHIITAIEAEGKLLLFPKYAIKAVKYVSKDIRLGEFGWTISILPRQKKTE